MSTYEALALGVAILSLLISIWNRFDAWRQRRQRDQVFIQPLRFEPVGQKVFFRVAAGSPVREVKFEFIKNRTGGTATRKMVAGGEIRFEHRDFVSEPGTLVLPDGQDILVATAWWRRKDRGKWETCGTYVTGSNSYSFRLLDSGDEG